MTTTLKRGSRGVAVRALQEIINKAVGAPAVKVDSDFGPATEAAVKAAQQRLELVVDGIAGPQTQTALKREAEPVKPGRAEPGKSAMDDPTIPDSPYETPFGEPPNIGAFKLLDTARPISEIIVHCTATPEGKHFTVDDVRAWHKARGFTDIGYHYLIYPDGRVMLGRPVGQVGSHVAGHNTGTIGVSYFGGVAADGKIAKDTRTPEQRSSLLWLVQQLKTKHSGIRKVTGHNQYAAKACPSFRVEADPLGQLAA